LAFITINKNNFFHNLRAYEKHLGDKNKIALVLKDNAYGHGIDIIASLAKEFGIKKAIVRTVQEAKQIETYFDFILILAQIPKEKTSFIITINSLEDISLIPKKSKVHLKIDTGMHRNGIDSKEIDIALEEIKKQNLILDGIFTHYKSADTLGSEFFWQQKQFKLLKQKFDQKLLFHSCNSSASFRVKKHTDDFVRVGIGAYGNLVMDTVFNAPLLKPILSLWANKTKNINLKKGQSIGYNGKFTAKEDILCAVYDIGYSDGLLRMNPKKSYILEDTNSKILGSISMDNSVIQSQENTLNIFSNANHFALFHQTISYEILVNLNKNIKRTII